MESSVPKCIVDIMEKIDSVESWSDVEIVFGKANLECAKPDLTVGEITFISVNEVVDNEDASVVATKAYKIGGCMLFFLLHRAGNVMWTFARCENSRRGTE